MRCLIQCCYLMFVTIFLTNRASCDEDGPHFSSTQLEHSGWANGIALGDVNGDGHLDALIGYRKYCAVWIGNGKGNFAESGRFYIERVGNIDLVDLEVNNRLHAVVNGVLWRNDGTGTFTKGSTVLAGQKLPRFHDLDNDGDMDAVTGGNITVHWNDGRGQFKSQTVQLDQKAVGQVSLVDMDRDGLADIVIWGRGECRIVFNEGGLFKESRNVEFRGDEDLSVFGPQFLWGDFDGDDDLDVAMVQYGWDDMAPEDYIWLQDGKLQFRMSQVIRGYEQWGSEAAKADFDQDGDVDLFIGQDGGANKLWLNDGKGKFSRSIELGSGTHAVAVGDVDGDGDVDIFTVGCRPPTVWINECTKPATGAKQ